MKKLILSMLCICFIINILNSMETDNNCNNNNFQNNNKIIPKDHWEAIATQLINIIINAKTLPKLEKAIYDFQTFSLTSKMHVAIVQDLINRKLSIKNNKKITLKEYYVQRKNAIIQEIKEILKTKLPHSNFDWFNDINARTDLSKATLLIFVASINYIKIAKLLIDNGADINAKDSNGNTALIEAAYGNNHEIAKLLIDNNADLNCVNRFGQTAVTIASDYHHKKIAKLLKKNRKITTTERSKIKEYKKSRKLH